nr:hypothetical protein [Tanacetum cinerariifolium]
GFHKNLQIQLPPTRHNVHVEDIVVFKIAIAQIFLCPGLQCHLHNTGIDFLQQWELSSLAVETSSGSGNSITGSGNALCILFPTNLTCSNNPGSTFLGRPFHNLNHIIIRLQLFQINSTQRVP